MANPALTPNIRGQIVSIYLENFMTYSKMQLMPGFHLNVIIGPNGTGKSTIVCAVVLGLGGKLKTLGRATHLNAYIKSGCSEGIIEIELYRPEGNVTIKRKINQKNQSSFFLNGESVPAIRVSELRRELNIQVDNLCTFLPQEKVQDFAKMNSVQLLEQTQGTIDGGDLVEKHVQLKELRKEMISWEAKMQSHNVILASEISKNENLHEKVRALKEKKALDEKVTTINQKRCWLEYNELIKKKQEVEKDHVLASKAMEQKKKSMELSEVAIRQIKDNSKQQLESSQNTKKEEARKRSDVEDRVKKLQLEVNKLASLKNNLASELAQEKSKKDELLRCQAKVDKLGNDLNALQTDKGEEANIEANQLAEQQNILHKTETELSRQKTALEEDLRNLQYELKTVIADQRLLENRRAARREYFRVHKPDVYKGILWLEKNEHLFSSKVFNPILLEIDVPNSKLAKYVENAIPMNCLEAFVTTSDQDFALLVKKLRGEMKLKFNVLAANDLNKTEFKSNYPIESLRNYGFSSYISDLITGPEPILALLKRRFQLHNIPIGNEMVSKHFDKVPAGIKRFMSATHVYEIRQSSYSREKSMKMQKLREAILFSISVDTSEIKRLNIRQGQLKKEITEKEKDILQVTENMAKTRESLEDLIKRQRYLKNCLEERGRIQLQLKCAKDQFDRVKKSIRDSSTIKAIFLKKRKELMEKILSLVFEVQKTNEALDSVFVKYCRTTLAYKASISGLEAKQREFSEAKDAFLRAQQLERRLVENIHKIGQECDAAQALAKKMTGGYGPTDHRFRAYQVKFKELKDTIDELEKELQEIQARADFLDSGSIKVLQEFENREKEIKKMQAESEELSSNLMRLKEEVKSCREDWLLPVQELVQNINNNFGEYFSFLGCSGEVALQVPENENDFDKYGIKILVKYRDGTPLQELSRYFHSGGERAVATAVYMLALQHLTNVPFRFVDEINQGMDPINERRITELIVRVTAPLESSQYFFITPKILTNVECVDTMSVLCVYNGSGSVPTKKWDISKFLRVEKELLR